MDEGRGRRDLPKPPEVCPTLVGRVLDFQGIHTRLIELGWIVRVLICCFCRVACMAGVLHFFLLVNGKNVFLSIGQSHNFRSCLVGYRFICVRKGLGSLKNIGTV